MSRKTDAPVVLLQTLICDDVRYEFNGKITIVGVFTGDIIIGSIPAALNLTLVALGNATRSGNHQFSVRVIDDRKDVVFQVDPKGEVIVAEPGPANITLQGLNVPLLRQGTLRFEIKFSDGPWSQLLEKQVRIGAPAPHPMNRLAQAS